MSDAQEPYEQHDRLDEHLTDIRRMFMDHVAKFGGWDADENAFDEQLDVIEERLKGVHGLINDLEQIEIDRAGADRCQNHGDVEHAADLIEKTRHQLVDIDDDLGRLEKAVKAWIDRSDSEDPEDL